MASEAALAEDILVSSEQQEPEPLMSRDQNLEENQ